MTVRSFIHLAALAALLPASVMHGQRTNRSPSDSPDLASGSAATSLAVVNARIWTGDARRSMRVARAMRCGQVFVNAYGAGGGIELPFGGVKKSGHGREKGFEALYEFSASKTIVVSHG